MPDAAPNLTATPPVQLPTADAGPARAGSSKVLLAAVLLGCLIVPTGVSGTGVALPAIAADTGASAATLQWVVNAFNLAFACSTLLAGSLADIFGRKRLFMTGASTFLVASILSASTTNIVVLDIARALAGIGAAAIFSCGGALLATNFEGKSQLRAFAFMGTAAGLGLGLGPTISGLLVDRLGWQTIFVFNAVGIAVVLILVAIAKSAPETLRHEASIDTPGSVTFVGGLLLLIFAIVQGGAWGWTAPGTLALLAAGVVLLAVFVAVERRCEHPMFDFSVLRDRRMVGLIMVPVTASFGFVTLLTYLPTYMSMAWGDSVGTAGLKMLVMTVPIVIAPVLAGWIAQRGVEPRHILACSLLFFVIGPAWLLVIGPQASFLSVIVPMVLIGAGFGLGVGLVDGEALRLVSPEKSGMAAGLVNTARLGSEAIAVAIYGALLTTFTASKITDSVQRAAGPGVDPHEIADQVSTGKITEAAAHAPAADRADFAHSLITGYDAALHTMLWVLVAVGALLTVLVVGLLRPSTRTR
ncbi:MFS transporter [Streptomyces sp. NPDC058657]|uniref:MFS transporter n=1 Tax=unclassified Streptomyces TaxID=2593676 RepID=UPI0036613486